MHLFQEQLPNSPFITNTSAPRQALFEQPSTPTPRRTATIGIPLRSRPNTHIYPLFGSEEAISFAKTLLLTLLSAVDSNPLLAIALASLYS